MPNIMKNKKKTPINIPDSIQTDITKNVGHRAMGQGKSSFYKETEGDSSSTQEKSLLLPFDSFTTIMLCGFVVVFLFADLFTRANLLVESFVPQTLALITFGYIALFVIQIFITAKAHADSEVKSKFRNAFQFFETSLSTLSVSGIAWVIIVLSVKPEATRAIRHDQIYQYFLLSFFGGLFIILTRIFSHQLTRRDARSFLLATLGYIALGGFYVLVMRYCLGNS